MILLQNFISSFTVHIFVPNLCTPFKLTEKFWTLVNTNSSFSLTQLLTMF